MNVGELMNILEKMKPNLDIYVKTPDDWEKGLIKLQKVNPQCHGGTLVFEAEGI